MTEIIRAVCKRVPPGTQREVLIKQPFLIRTGDFGQMESKHDRRRRYQFRLGTLLRGMAQAGPLLGYVAHEANIVRERKASYGWHSYLNAGYQQSLPTFWYGDRTEKPSRLRKWLGDQTYSFIVVRDAAPEAEKRAVAALFPEADIRELPLEDEKALKNRPFHGFMESIEP